MRDGDTSPSTSNPLPTKLNYLLNRYFINCCNSSGISLLSVVGKLYGRALIKRVRAGTECALGGRSNVGLGRVEDAWTKCLP